MKLIVSQEALADVERLRIFLAEKSSEAAQRAAAVLIAAIETLHTFPDRGRPCGPSGLRELIVPFGRSAYVIRYAHFTQRDEVVVLRVWHGRESRD